MRSFLIILAALRMAAAADSTLAGYFPPDTKVVMGVNVRGMIDNPIFGEALGEIRSKSPELLAGTPFAGFDPLQDLDEILVATSGKGDNPPAVVVLRGRFAVDQLAKNASRYHDIPILQSPQQPEGVLALIDGSTAIAGTAAEIHAAIDRQGEVAPANAALLSRVDTMRARYGIWGFGDGVENKRAHGAQTGDLSSIDRFEFGIGFEHGLRMTAELHARTTEDAEKMAAMLRLLEGMINAQKTKKTAKDLGLELRADKGTLKFSLTIPESEMKKAVQEERAALVNALSARMPSLLAPKAASAPVRVNPTVPAGQDFTIESGSVPASSEGKTVTNSKGDTVILTLPGK